MAGPHDLQRRRLQVNGIVQGVGFRPFVYNLARDLGLTGTVTNTSDGVIIEIQGTPERLDQFEVRLVGEAPALSRIVSVKGGPIPVGPDTNFEILFSSNTPGTTTLIPPDVATCADCLAEIRHPLDRRFDHPFANCTNCGPRWTIIDRIPYDRPYTAMAPFTMCAACQAEYDDPADRRFHAQPNACPECGPRLWLEDVDGKVEAADPLDAAAELLAEGRIVAIKGLGGFHLACRADEEEAVIRLRERKHREAKPLAVMVADLETAGDLAQVTEAEAAALASPSAPIVLLEKTLGGPQLAPSVAESHQRLGLMLPYTPLHHVLMTRLKKRGITALVMTSGNHSEEPICLSNDEARTTLRGIADAWVLHDREIIRRADDSVLQVLDDGPLFFRRSRGYAPVPVFIQGAAAEGEPVLAVGPELKNTLCVLKEDRAFLSPHIGDLENLQAFTFFQETAATLQDVLECEPEVIAHDLHPRYFSTTWAKKQEKQGKRLIGVQHHHAHLAAVLAEHGMDGPAIGLIMDGTGFGTDGNIWGGEVLVGDVREFTRLGHLEPAPLPGGEAAIRNPWRTALGYLWQAFDGEVPEIPFLAGHPIDPVVEALAKGVNAPMTTSCGRLFDAIAGMTGWWPEIHYEAQAAIELMAQTTWEEVAEAKILCPPELTGDGPFVIAVSPLVRAVAKEIQQGLDPIEVSTRFHKTLMHHLAAAAVQASRTTGLKDVVLAGGVFQNEILLRGLMEALPQMGLRPVRPLELPANDGAVAVGQAAVARARLAAES